MVGSRENLRHGFTLIELMIVVAVIAVLIAILVPSLAASRVRARTTVCASNLRGLGIATSLYLDENGGEFFRYYMTAGPAYPLGAGRLWWFGFEAGGPVAGTNRPLDKSASPLAPYTASLAEKMMCPEFPYDDSGFYPKFSQHAASYGYNLKLGPTSMLTSSNRQMYLSRMKDVVVFADGIHFDFGTTFNEGHYLQYTAGATIPSGYAHFRHPRKVSGEAQMVYLDGHVDSQRLSGPSYKLVGGSSTGNLVGPDGGNGIYGF